MINGIYSPYGANTYISPYSNGALSKAAEDAQNAKAGQGATADPSAHNVAAASTGNNYQTGIDLPTMQLAQGSAARPWESNTQAAAGQQKDSGMGIDTDKAQGASKDEAVGKECQTCKNRKYQDQSADPGVSFKSPTQVSPEAAPAAVAGHEQQHITRERVQAEQEGREVVSQSVRIKMAICPECGKAYVAGGEAVTTTREATPNEKAENRKTAEIGTYMDVRA